MADWRDYLFDPTEALDALARHYTGDLLFPYERVQKGRQQRLDEMLQPPLINRAKTLRELGEPPQFAPPALPRFNVQDLGPRGAGGGMTVPMFGGELEARGSYFRPEGAPRPDASWWLNLRGRF